MTEKKRFWIGDYVAIDNLSHYLNGLEGIVFNTSADETQVYINTAEGYGWYSAADLVHLGYPETTPIELCEVLSKWMNFRYGKHYSAKEICEYSPTGELFMIFEWRNMARRDLEFVATLRESDRAKITLIKQK